MHYNLESGIELLWFHHSNKVVGKNKFYFSTKVQINNNNPPPQKKRKNKAVIPVRTKGFSGLSPYYVRGANTLGDHIIF